jgi:CubicO group peptidase (beta-lactamase class C family)
MSLYGKGLTLYFWAIINTIVMMITLPSAFCQPDRAIDTAELNKILYQAVKEGFSGSVLISQKDTVILHKGLGTIAGRPVEKNDRFWIASSGKQFVSAAIIKLSDQGNLKLSDSLGRFFLECPADKKMITIFQLLTHTSGLGQSYVSEALNSRTIALKRIFAEPLAGPPGEKFRYSNINIQLCAAIIEQVSGISYKKYVTRNLFRPAHLDRTGFAGDSGAALVSPIADTLPVRLIKRYWGEQGVYSTTGDLYKWWIALQSGKIVSLSGLKQLFKPAVQISEGQAALCWFTGKTLRGNQYIFTRGNEDFGANSLVYAYPDRQLVIIILTHAGDMGDYSWSRKLQNAISDSLNL